VSASGLEFKPDGAVRFERPDVHAGDRPAGASFASRSAVLGCSAAAGRVGPDRCRAKWGENDG